jgi:hypothetical protein
MIKDFMAATAPFAWARIPHREHNRNYSGRLTRVIHRRRAPLAASDAGTLHRSEHAHPEQANTFIESVMFTEQPALS